MPETDAIPTRIDQVTVLAHGARVRRVAAPRPVAELPDRVRFDALPVSVIDGTVRAAVEGPAVVTALRGSLDDWQHVAPQKLGRRQPDVAGV